MSFLESLFLNYIPLALIALGVLWYLGAFKRFRKSERETEESSPAKTCTAKPRADQSKEDKLRLPPNRERLAAFAKDMSGDNPEIVRLAKEMMRSGTVPEVANDVWEYDDQYSIGSGPDAFAGVLVSVLTDQFLNGTPKPPVVYFDWKEDMPECCEGFADLYQRTTGEALDFAGMVDIWPGEVRFADNAPIVTSALARECFERAGLVLLEIISPEGWDAHLFAAVPAHAGRRWKNIALRAGPDTTKAQEVLVQDAYFTAADFIEAHRPEGVTFFEGKTGERKVSVYWYWEDKK